jgi:hypothetical protein
MAAKLRKTPYDTPAIKPIRTFLKKRYKDFVRTFKINSVGTPLQQREGDNGLAKALPAISSAAAISAAGSTQQIWSNFLSIDFYENPIGWPPDPNGAVGPSQVIVASNNGLKVHEKTAVTDAPRLTPKGYSGVRARGLFISLEEFFSPILSDSSFIGDPHIRYDRLSKRWIIVAIDFQNNLILLAVSDGDRVTNSSSFTFYSFDASLFPYDPAAPYKPIIDYPRMGVDKNSVLIGGNQFGYDSLTNVGYVIDKKKLIRGQLVIYPFQFGVVNFITGTVNGMYTPQGVYNDNPSGKISSLIGISYYQDELVLARLSYDTKNRPRLESQVTIPVEPFNYPREITAIQVV